jgi:hypothetical protein
MYQWQDSSGAWHTEETGPDDTARNVNDPTGSGNGYTPNGTYGGGARGPQSSLDPNIIPGDRRTGPSPTQQVSSNNFDWGGSGTGAQDDIFQNQLANDAAQQRTGVKLDNYDANEQFANALKARQNQQYLGGLYKQQLSGQGPSAANLGGQASLDAAIAAQHGAGLGASYGGGNSMLSSNAQFAGARGQETAAAAAGFGGNAQAMRGGDLSTMSLQQQQAYRQAQLEAEQRKRNDQMAQFYVNQSNQISAQQLHARESYQAQRDANALAAQGLYNQQQQRRQQQTADDVNGAIAVGGMLASAGQNSGGISDAANKRQQDDGGDNG